jgi:hypothetical protein
MQFFGKAIFISSLNENSKLGIIVGVSWFFIDGLLL